MLFGSEPFEYLIGELKMATLFSQATEPQPQPSSKPKPQTPNPNPNPDPNPDPSPNPNPNPNPTRTFSQGDNAEEGISDAFLQYKQRRREVCHTGLEPRTNRRPQAGLPLTRVSLAVGRWCAR